MNWWDNHPLWYANELAEIGKHPDYREKSQAIDRSLLSSGYILVRTSEIHRFPVLIVYPDGTPYVPPSIHLIERPYDNDELKRLAHFSPTEVQNVAKGIAKFFYHRHQNPDGSLCLLEVDDLHSERAETVGARAALSRVKEWCYGSLSGKFPMDSRETELYYHFTHRASDVELLLSESFFCGEIVEGTFYFQRSPYLNAKFYYGLGLMGRNAAGIERWSFEPLMENPVFFRDSWDRVELAARLPRVSAALENSTLIIGHWFDIQSEPSPFNDIKHLVDGLEGQLTIERLVSELFEELRRGKETIYLGLRFPGRFSTYEWAIVRLVGPPNAGVLFDPQFGELSECLMGYRVESIHTELVTEQYFHLRNQGRADRTNLRDKHVSLFGVGAIGSTLADLFAKAGVGTLRMIDKGELRPHNVIRHLSDLTDVGQHKVVSTGINVMKHNPFVKVDALIYDVMQVGQDEWDHLLPVDSIGVSSIADDNIEALVNERAVLSCREMFYVRALRGGKAGRIFRVRPGVDACKECLALYYHERNEDFIFIDDDPDLPLLTNECNNSVRPGSAADLYIIAGIASRLVLDLLHGKDLSGNHWVWTTESLGSSVSGSNVPYSLHEAFLGPHPQCRLCNSVPITSVHIPERIQQAILSEIQETGVNETGGILTGFYSQDGVATVMSASGPGPNAVRRPNWFERDVKFCQDSLQKSVEKFGAHGEYLGEWHFHPTGTNRPSPQDIKSMAEIAIQPNYATRFPIALIVSSSHDFGFTVHPPRSPYKSVPYEVVRDADAKE